MRPFLALLMLLSSACGQATTAAPTDDAVAADTDATADVVASTDVTATDAQSSAPKDRAPSQVALRDIVGLSSHPRLGADADAVAERKLEWQALADLGIHRLRTDFRFAVMEPQKGTFDFSAYDPLVAEAKAHGVDLLALLDATAPWATTVVNGIDSYPPKDPQDFATFAAKVAERYQATISEYEIWNEPNNGVTFWKAEAFTGEPDKYAALFLQSQKAILQAQPEAHIAFGAILDHFIIGSGPEFLQAALQSTPEVAKQIQTFSLHPYPLYPPTASPESAVGDEVPLSTQLATMNGLLAGAGNDTQATHFWLTELGWPTIDAVPPLQQARFTVRAILLSALGGADRLYLYTLLDDANAISPEGSFGLMTTDTPPKPKPAFVAIQTLMKYLGAYRVVDRITSAPDGTWLLHLQAGEVHAYAVWLDQDAGLVAPTVHVPLTGQVREIHMDGTVKTAMVTATSYGVAATQDPVLVMTAK